MPSFLTFESGRAIARQPPIGRTNPAINTECAVRATAQQHRRLTVLSDILDSIIVDSLAAFTKLLFVTVDIRQTRETAPTVVTSVLKRIAKFETSVTPEPRPTRKTSAVLTVATGFLMEIEWQAVDIERMVGIVGRTLCTRRAVVACKGRATTRLRHCPSC